MTTERVVDFLRVAAERRKANLPAAQQQAREELRVRQEALQSGPIKRGPNAPADGSFGGVKKAKP